jgi:hypothetical protein
MLTLSVSEAYEVYRNNPLSAYYWTTDAQTGDPVVAMYEPHTKIGEADVSALLPDEFAELYGSVLFLSAAEASMNPPIGGKKKGRKKKSS